jgi:hypothetical protein
MIIKVLSIILPKDIMIVYKQPDFRYYDSNWGVDGCKYYYASRDQMTRTHKIH